MKMNVRPTKLTPPIENPQISLPLTTPSNSLLGHFRSNSVKFSRAGDINLNSTFPPPNPDYPSFDDYKLSQYHVLLFRFPLSQTVHGTCLFFCRSLLVISPHPFPFCLTTPIDLHTAHVFK